MLMQAKMKSFQPDEEEHGIGLRYLGVTQIYTTQRPSFGKSEARGGHTQDCSH